MARDRQRSRRRSGGSASRRDRRTERERGGKRGRGSAARGRRSGGRAGRRRGGIDFSALDDDEERFDAEEYDDEESWDDDERAPRRRPKRRRRPERKRLSLMDLCTPVFGYAGLLPREGQDPQPAYRQFRDEVLAALKRIETEAAEHGIEAADARQACYALSFFMDTQVASSAWNAASEWATEPLGIVLQQDPEGGVNFFRRLEGFGDREREVKEVFLVCLALGFRGKFAELEPAEQAARIGEIRQRLVREIRPEPLDKLPELFPEAYREAETIEDEVPPPPRWWLFASMGIVAAVLLIWIGLYVWAGRTSRPAMEQVDEVLADREQVATRFGESAVEPLDGGSER
jgi:type VI secretion system protein ImpK